VTELKQQLEDALLKLKLQSASDLPHSHRLYRLTSGNGLLDQKLLYLMRFVAVYIRRCCVQVKFICPQGACHVFMHASSLMHCQRSYPLLLQGMVGVNTFGKVALPLQCANG